MEKSANPKAAMRARAHEIMADGMKPVDTEAMMKDMLGEDMPAMMKSMAEMSGMMSAMMDKMKAAMKGMM